MDFMMILLIVLRALHIVAAFVWMGFGLSAGLILGSMLAKAKPQEAHLIARAWYLHSPFTQIIPIAAITTVVAGLVMYGLRNPASLVMGTTNAQIVLGIGALFGLMAFGHGIAVGRMTGKYTNLAKDAGDNPNQEQITALQELGLKLGRNGRVSMILMFIALLGMVLPRYL